jgi:hypothetical protein
MVGVFGGTVVEGILFCAGISVAILPSPHPVDKMIIIAKAKNIRIFGRDGWSFRFLIIIGAIILCCGKLTPDFIF